MERKEAIEVIKKNWPDSSFTMLREALGTLIPELKESEGERMVKFIKNQLFNIKKTITDNYKLDKELTKAIDWLEKQGEQKHIEEYNITGIKSKHAEGKLGEMIKNLKPVNEVLEQKPADNQFTPEQAGILDKHIDKFLEQNPWSEEDEKILNYLLWFYDTRFRWNDTCHDDIKFGDIVTFLKSLKDRVQPQPKREWSEEDEEMLNRIICDIESLKEQVYCKTLCNEEIDWLKSLRPRSQWKPSENELEVLRLAAEKDGTCLMGLYENLKKLKG